MSEFSKHWKNSGRFFQTLEKLPSVFPRIGKKVSNHWKKGLTLIEVMLAVVILGVGAGVLMLATARCLAVATKARHYSTAQRLILRVGAENPITRSEISAGTESGDFEDGISWEREISEPESEDREGLYTVRTRVSWSARGKERFEEIVTLHYIEPKDDR